MHSQICIAVDAMGGDFGPRVTVEASLAALARHPQLRLQLVGDERQLSTYLPDQLPERLVLVHAPAEVGDDSRIQQALRLGSESSLYQAIERVKLGESEAVVSAGNTGALMALAKRALGTLEGVERPAITAAVPTLEGSCQVLDLGANIDCSAQMLVQFAALGAALVRLEHRIDSPRVGLLNIGVEQSKGTETLRTASKLIEQLPDIEYLGFVEGDDLFEGRADLVVCDGLTGNVALKSSEGLASLIRAKVKRSFSQSWYRNLLAWLAAPILRELQSELDAGARNGAVLLGLRGLVIKSHGSADTRDFGFAIDHAVAALQGAFNARLEADVRKSLTTPFSHSAD